MNNRQSGYKILGGNMEAVTQQFPKEFGGTPDLFLQQYERLIYKVIIKEKIRINLKCDLEDLFQDFFIHIADRNYKRLQQYKGKSLASTYLVTILRHFLYHKKRKMSAKDKNVYETSSKEKEMNPSNIFKISSNYSRSSNDKNESIKEAFEATFSRIPLKKKLIFDLTYRNSDIDGRMSAKDISAILSVTKKSVYKSNERVRTILRDELKKRSIRI